MRSEVIVCLDKGVKIELLAGDGAPMAADVARVWLDAQFTALECEPLRASGKVLTADKVLCIAQAAGADRFADAQWASEFARAVQGALARPMVRVDVPAMALTY